MDLSNEINSVLSLNKHSDASQEKVTEKIRDKVKKFLLGSNAASSVRHPNLLSQAPTIEMFMRGIAEQKQSSQSTSFAMMMTVSSLTFKSHQNVLGQ